MCVRNSMHKATSIMPKGNCAERKYRMIRLSTDSMHNLIEGIHIAYYGLSKLFGFNVKICAISFLLSSSWKISFRQTIK